jgi:hypothetical protein
VVNGYLDELAYDNGAVVQVQVDTGQIAVAYPFIRAGSRLTLRRFAGA